MTENGKEINENFPKEWETARTLLSFFDDKLYDLRKYGFGFITALIAATSVLLSGLAIGTDVTTWPDEVKFAILFVTLILIVAVTIVDRNFVVIQRAAATRARVLERTMNIELTEIITQRYRSAGAGNFATVLYVFLVLAIIVLGNFALNLSSIYYVFLMIASGVAITSLFVIRHYIKVDYPNGEIDWTIDRLRCTEKDKIGITLTNLSEKESLKFEANKDASKTLWEVRKEGGTTSISGDHGKIKENLVIPPNDSYTWLWPTDDCCGVYRVYRLITTKSELLPLKRKIIIKKYVKPNQEPTLVKLVKT